MAADPVQSRLRNAGHKPFMLNSPRRRIRLKDYAYNWMRDKVLPRTNPECARRLMELVQELVNLRWET
ncbi:MAG: hypothetical protein DIZ77_05580 [endosymbiont of Seepiophila jonesi]|uniref:Uncharacterized protein n=1 Tax=endosymbiont of Lamellibrachia luymesi TaxID=2200907 RepID=A0A370DYG9_9GAMM|nr:MAG: hypothetical protein DIZ79_06320 [endosymbiont of Lamellibrachia luymesi]RDH93601.1 MAG: hypothetical protein DIZ77_05580 [endosymbiont of Seepiophila jonesi]